MNWILLQREQQLNELLDRSAQRPQVIFKHSNRCGASQLVRSRLERTELPPAMDFYFLDLITYRDISDKIAENFDVWHESPQVLVIRNGKCIYDESHLAIRMESILKHSA